MLRIIINVGKKNKGRKYDFQTFGVFVLDLRTCSGSSNVTRRHKLTLKQLDLRRSHVRSVSHISLVILGGRAVEGGAGITEKG